MKKRGDVPLGLIRSIWLRIQQPVKRAGVLGTILLGAGLSLYAAAQMMMLRVTGLQ